MTQKTKRDEKFVRVKHACTVVSARDCQHAVCTMCRTRVMRVCTRGGGGFKSKRIDKTKQKARETRKSQMRTITNEVWQSKLLYVGAPLCMTRRCFLRCLQVDMSTERRLSSELLQAFKIQSFLTKHRAQDFDALV